MRYVYNSDALIALELTIKKEEITNPSSRAIFSNTLRQEDHQTWLKVHLE